VRTSQATITAQIIRMKVVTSGLRKNITGRKNSNTVESSSDPSNCPVRKVKIR